MTGTVSVHIIIPVHNRKDTTRACLSFLRSEGAFDWATVVVVDDGSTDGSSEAVQSEYPEAHLLKGDGSWWWGGSVRRGMEYAREKGAGLVIWLNDDCRPPHGALAELAAFSAREACIAWIDAVSPGGWRYGGYRKGSWALQRCTEAEQNAGRSECFSGNCVCIPIRWIHRCGLPDDLTFPHSLCDMDYGLRLSMAGAPLKALPGFVAENSDPSPMNSSSWTRGQVPMLEIWRSFSHPRSYLHFRSWRRFALRHWGWFKGPVVFVLPYLRWAVLCMLRPWFPRPTHPAP